MNNDTELKTQIKSTVEATVKGAIVHGPALIKAVIDSGLIGDLFHDISNDSELQDVFAKIAKELFNDAVELVEGQFNISSSGSSSSGSSSPLSIRPTGSGSSHNSITKISLGGGSSPTASSNTDLSLPSGGSGSGVTYSSIDLSGLDKRENYEMLEKDDLANVVISIVQEIANSGIVQSLVQKVVSNPQQVVNFLSAALREGTVILLDLYNWAKQSGILQEGLNWLAKNAGGIVGTLAGFVAKLFGDGSSAASGSAAPTAAAQATATTAQTLATTATATTLTTVAL